MHSVHVPLRTRATLLAEEQTRLTARAASAAPRQVAEGDRTARAVHDHPVYAGMIREMDETVATVLAAVEESGQTDSTVVIFTSDNGGLSTAEGSPTSNLPLRAGKGFLYEGGIRVPLVVRWPGVVRPGSTTAVPASTLDIAGDGPNPGSEKLIEHLEDGRVELFDLATDPGESHDLADVRPERAAALRARLESWRAAVHTKMPSPNPEPVDPFGPLGAGATR